MTGAHRPCHRARKRPRTRRRELEREAERSGRPRAQPQECRPRHPPRFARRVHRPVRVGKVQPRVRHDLRRGAAPLRRVAERVRPPVPRAGRPTGCRLHRGAEPRRLDRPEVDEPQPALDGRHDHRDPRLHAPALGAHRRAALPRMRRGHPAPDRAADRRSARRAARAHPLPDRRSGRHPEEGRVRRPLQRARRQGLRARDRRRRAHPARRAAHAQEDLQARHRRRGGSPRRRLRHPQPRDRLGRDGLGTRRRRHAGQLRRRGGGCRVAELLREARLSERPPAAAHRDRAADVLVQRAVRRVPDLLGPRHADVGGCRPHARRRGAVHPRGRAHPVDHPGQGTLPVLRAPARRPRGRPQLLARHPVERPARRRAGRGAPRRELQGHGALEEPLRPRDALRLGLRGRRALHRAAVRAGRVRLSAPEVVGVPPRGALPRRARATGSSPRCSRCSCTGIRSRMPRA